jgi:hypothetical protein
LSLSIPHYHCNDYFVKATIILAAWQAQIWLINNIVF